jgi:hypothetical protein
MKLKIKIIYFAFLQGDHWEEVICEQMNSLKSLPLYEEAEEILMSVVCNDEQLKRLKQHIWAKWKKVKIVSFQKQNSYEYPGIKSLWDTAKNSEDCVILYFHTKGISETSKKRGGGKFRKILFDGTIKNYQVYLNEFRKKPTLDSAMMFPSENYFAWYNFFWIRSSYVKNYLPEPQITKDRYYWERWIGNEHSSKKNPSVYSPLLGYKNFKNKAQFTIFRNQYLKKNNLL